MKDVKCQLCPPLKPGWALANYLLGFLVAGFNVFQSKGVVETCFSNDWMLFTGLGVSVFSMVLISGSIQSWTIQSSPSSCSSGSALMMDLVTSGFSVDLEDFDFLGDLDEHDFLDLDERDFLDFVYERWLPPLELRETMERVDPMMGSLFVSTIVSNSSTAC